MNKSNYIFADKTAVIIAIYFYVLEFLRIIYLKIKYIIFVYQFFKIELP